MNELNHYLEAFSSLHTASIKGHRAPHKAVLLLSVIDLVEKAEITSPHICLTDSLCHKFTAVWKRHVGESDSLLAAEPPATAASKDEKKKLPAGGYSVKAMRNAFAYAEMELPLFRLLQHTEARAALREVLMHVYLTDQPAKA